MKIVLVEDDAEMAAGLAYVLGRDGFVVDVVGTGAEALRRFAEVAPDAAIIDLGLPDMDGAEIIRAARAAGQWMPILVATGHGEVDERVRVLDAGADDFVVKPFAASEVLARLRALIRRAAAPRWAPLQCGRVMLTGTEREAVAGGAPLSLSPRERDLLEFLLRRRGQIVTREEILAEVFGYDFNPGTNLVDVHVAHLRRKLQDTGVRIRTVRAVGFCLEETQEE